MDIKTKVLEYIPNGHYVWIAPDIYFNSDGMASASAHITIASPGHSVDIAGIDPIGTVFYKRITYVSPVVPQVIPLATGIFYRLTPTYPQNADTVTYIQGQAESLPLDERIHFPKTGTTQIIIELPGAMEH
ncbi:MAG: hypothetical protein H7X80_06580, partial [bacterium]|nr:hypothetical protein [Candidatus Kapabacteria bacterium]